MLLGGASLQANQTQGNLSESRCSCREDKAVSTESSFRSVNAFGQANSGCSRCVGERKWPYDIAGFARLPGAGAFDTIFKVRGFAKHKRKSVLIICCIRLCCVSFAEAAASNVLFALLRSCNRSTPHQELLRYSGPILIRLEKTIIVSLNL